MIRRFVAAIFLSLAGLPAWAYVDIQEVTSPGGTTAWLVENHQIPFVALEIRFKGGAALDAPGKRGAINLMTGLLEEGAGDYSDREFAAARDALAASFNFEVYNDSLGISARFLTENRDQALDLLRDVLINPRFDEAALDRVRNQVLASIKSDQTDPDSIASQTFNELAFSDHPYATPREGTMETVQALTRDDIVDAKARVMARDRLFVSAVGDITADELSTILDKLFAELPETGAPFPGPAEYHLTGGTTVVPFDTPQSVTVFGHQGLDRHDPDFFVAFVMNAVLGSGGYSSRLMEEVREKRGLTYGVYSYLYPLDYSALILGQFASANDSMAEGIDVVRAEWARMATEGVSAEELEKVQTYLTGAYPLRFDGNGPIADILVGMQMEELGIDYAATRNDKVRAVTVDDVKRVAKRLLDPDALHFVVVGRPEGLESTN